jgi:hypothetical protein
MPGRSDSGPEPESHDEGLKAPTAVSLIPRFCNADKCS